MGVERLGLGGVLRRKEPNLPRPFRIPGPDWVPIALAVSPTLLTFYALYAARTEHVAGMPAAVRGSSPGPARVARSASQTWMDGHRRTGAPRPSTYRAIGIGADRVPSEMARAPEGTPTSISSLLRPPVRGSHT